MKKGNVSRARPRIFAAALAALAVAFASSCSSMADYDFSTIDANLAAGSYSAVLEEIEKNGEDIYSSHDEVLSALDLGLLAHFEGRPADSVKSLSRAEELMEEYRARSITQTIASALTNDLAMDYSGEAFESVYSNLFMSLDFLALGSVEDALVEVRRFDNKVKLLKSWYEEEVESAESDGEVTVETVATQFTDSALARWLSMLLYRADGDTFNAEVDLKMLREAFSRQPQLYEFSPPSSLDEEVAVPKGYARVNVVAFSGRAPIKVEDVTRVAAGDAGAWFKLALPVLKRIPSEITEIGVMVRDKKTGKVAAVDAEKIESLETISEDTFQQHLSIIRAKSIARALVRTATTATMDVLSAKAANDNNAGAALAFGLAGLFSKAYNEGVERADVRTGRYFPASAHVAGVTVPPGEYTVTVNFFSGDRIVRTDKKDIKATAKGINLVEAACLR